MEVPIIETERLILREFREDDFPVYERMAAGSEYQCSFTESTGPDATKRRRLRVVAVSVPACCSSVTWQARSAHR